MGQPQMGLAMAQPVQGQVVQGQAMPMAQGQAMPMAQGAVAIPAATAPGQVMNPLGPAQAAQPVLVPTAPPAAPAGPNISLAL